MSVKLPISAKGIIQHEGKILLLKNERTEWELPGGRLERGETVEECVCREIYEELRIACTSVRLNDVWVYEVYHGREVFIVTYICDCPNPANIVISDEHNEFRWFTPGELERLHMPEGYKASIRKAVAAAAELNGEKPRA